MRTRDCDAAVRSGRLRKAEEFLQVALTLVEAAAESADAQVTLFVDAGIAAADVICCSRLKEHSVGENHEQAVALLKRADAQSAPHLARLLGMKSKAAYSHAAVSGSEQRTAQRAATALVERAREI